MAHSLPIAVASVVSCYIITWDTISRAIYTIPVRAAYFHTLAAANEVSCSIIARLTIMSAVVTMPIRQTNTSTVLIITSVMASNVISLYTELFTGRLEVASVTKYPEKICEKI